MEVPDNATPSSSPNQRRRRRWRSLRGGLREFLRLLRLSIMESLEYFRGMSPTFICFTIFVIIFENYMLEYWKGPESITSHILVELGSKYSIYAIITSSNRETQHRITLNVSTFSTMLFVDLPYVLAYVDLQLRPSLFSAWGFISFIICFSTVADTIILNERSRHLLEIPLYLQLYCQSFLRFLVLLGLIVVGGANMFEKAYNGDLVYYKHVSIPLSLCVLAFIRFRAKYSKLSMMRENALRLIP